MCPCCRRTAHRRTSCRNTSIWPRQARTILFAYPAQSNFSGVQHSPGMDQTRAGKRLDVLLRCGGVRAYQPARSQRVASRVLSRFRFTKSSAIRPASAVCSRAAPRSKNCAVPGSRADDHDCVRARGWVLPGRGEAPSKTVRSQPARRRKIGLKHITALNLRRSHTRVMCLTTG